jgi:hypothetical protein
MGSIAEIVHSRGVANDRAKIAENRNHFLRRSSTGRLLLVIERCLALVNGKSGTDRRRWSRLTDDLSYACELADEAGVPNGYVGEGPKKFSFAFALSGGDVVFTNLKDTLGADVFPGQPLASNNSLVLAHAIAEIMSQQSNSALRRSTRIPADVPVEVERNGLVYSGETITVNLHGALVKLPANLRSSLKRGDRVTVKVHPTGKSASGAVVFANEALHQFGIELQHPENIWGVIPQPPDWENARA